MAPRQTVTATVAVTPTASATSSTPPPASSTATVDLDVRWFVGEDRVAYISRVPADDPDATPAHFRDLASGSAEDIPLPLGWDYFVDVPGPTATIWPTDEPETATPTPSDTATPAPTQTPYFIVVTATPRPLSVRVWLPMIWERR